MLEGGKGATSENPKQFFYVDQGQVLPAAALKGPKHTIVRRSDVALGPLHGATIVGGTAVLP